MKKLLLECARLPDGWHNDVLITLDDSGKITDVTPEADGETQAAEDLEKISGACLPGVGNLHSHAFQRAMTGLAEVAGPSGDSFWTWRKVMYGFLAKITPDDLEAIAAQLYLENLKAGYTGMTEFHYLHHAPDGQPYDDLAEMSERILAAAAQTGLALTHLPVLYNHSGFGGTAGSEGQRRFLNDGDRFLTLLQTLNDRHGGSANVNLGIAPHSLRAVTPDLLDEVLTGLDGFLPGCPLHIHIAEQTKEVEDCLAWSGKRPVQWLLDHQAAKGQPLDSRWCLIHATHLTEQETTDLAHSGAIAGLCPTTEANLGDGLFPIEDYLAQGGAFGVGSDSHISVDLTEELRLLENGPRLTKRGRNLLAGGEGQSTGARLYTAAAAGSAAALGRPSGEISKGNLADLLVLNRQDPALIARQDDHILDSWIFFNGPGSPVSKVFVAGQEVITDGHHKDEEAITQRYLETLTRLMT
ncbi:formimidoylglutamate deiminase [Rhodovibrionaceae bacterium A322]